MLVLPKWMNLKQQNFSVLKEIYLCGNVFNVFLC